MKKTRARAPKSPGPNQQLGAVWAELRTKRGISQLEAAEALGLSSSYVSLIEAGHRTPRMPVILRAAELYRVPLPRLCTVKAAKA